MLVFVQANQHLAHCLIIPLMLSAPPRVWFVSRLNIAVRRIRKCISRSSVSACYNLSCCMSVSVYCVLRCDGIGGGGRRSTPRACQEPARWTPGRPLFMVSQIEVVGCIVENYTTHRRTVQPSSFPWAMFVSQSLPCLSQRRPVPPGATTAVFINLFNYVCTN